jgi:prepilin-type N-terminal cleavage/methylation domain-containing protein
MKKIRSNSKKGFTLVELIVVLVILAVMAAMLVPALTGYIDEARKKKDYNAASEVLTAAQAVVAEYYGGDSTPTVAEAKDYVDNNSARISQLAGVQATVSGTSVGTDYQITGITVQLNGGNTYTWDGTKWS